jgi:hypothetical protein
VGKIRKAYKIFAGTVKGKRPLGRHRRRWEDNMRMDLVEKCGVNIPDSVQGPLLGSCKDGNEASVPIKVEFLDLPSNY